MIKLILKSIKTHLYLLLFISLYVLRYFFREDVDVILNINSNTKFVFNYLVQFVFLILFWMKFIKEINGFILFFKLLFIYIGLAFILLFSTFKVIENVVNYVTIHSMNIRTKLVCVPVRDKILIQNRGINHYLIIYSNSQRKNIKVSKELFHSINIKECVKIKVYYNLEKFAYVKIKESKIKCDCVQNNPLQFLQTK